METYRLHLPIPHPLVRNRNRAGFSLLEVTIAIALLIVGLSAMAALVAQSLSGTERARDLGLAATLTSEKLEDLNRWPTIDAHIAAGGSLGADTTVGTVDYFDDVIFSTGSGQESETVGTTTGGVTTYTTTTHSAGGVMASSTSTTAPAVTGQIAFHRRWLVEYSPIVNGITLTAPTGFVGPRRVTVAVTLSNLAIHPPVSFQMSLVRP